MDIEDIRKLFRPQKVKLLLVGESPPVSGKFFYLGGSMTAHTATAFKKAYGIEFDDQMQFLCYFRSRNCYLEDISHDPIDNQTENEREMVLEQNVSRLAKNIRI